MSYSFTAEGEFPIAPPLRPAHRAYLTQFGQTRRMRWSIPAIEQRRDPLREAVGLPLGTDGAYFVGFETGWSMHLVSDPALIDRNKPPDRQPDLYSQLMPNPAGSALIWTRMNNNWLPDQVIECWLDYLSQHFLDPWGYQTFGMIRWQGERPGHKGMVYGRHEQRRLFF
jgi:hypothetical protein